MQPDADRPSSFKRGAVWTPARQEEELRRERASQRKEAEVVRVAVLSERTIVAATPEAERFILWDERLKGFGLRVEPSGTKTFVARYRMGGGRRGTLRQFKVGRFGKLTVEQARDRATQVMAAVELGQDPQAVRAAWRSGAR